MKQQIYRQGDVIIRRVNRIPREAVKQSGKGRVILARGEVTGHHHSFAGEDVEVFEIGEEKYFDVTGRAFHITLPVVRAWKSQVMVKHPEFGLVEFSVNDVSVIGDKVEIIGKFGLLEHQEHTFQGIPSGLYSGGSSGKSVRQREYTPQAVRNVAD